MTLFMEKQGYPMKTNIFYQDNESAIKIEKMGENHAVVNQDTLM